MSLSEILRISRLCQRWGLTPSQARILAGIVYGEAVHD